MNRFAFLYQDYYYISLVFLENFGLKGCVFNSRLIHIADDMEWWNEENQRHGKHFLFNLSLYDHIQANKGEGDSKGKRR